MDPKIKSSYVKICYSADDGYRAETAYSSKRSGCPKRTLASAADEIARLAELFGCGDLVEEAVADARERVRQWRRDRDV